MVNNNNLGKYFERENNQKYGRSNVIQLLNIASVKTDIILQFKHLIGFINFLLSKQSGTLTYVAMPS